MILLSATNLRKHFGAEPVLDGVSFDIRPGEKISLVGPNGVGKSTLLKIMAQLEDPDGGQLVRHPSAQVEMLDQQPKFTANRTVWEEAAEALSDLRQLAEQAEQLARAISDATDERQRKQLGENFDRAQQELQRRDGYRIDHKIERVLDGLGFASATWTQPVGQLSGGQQSRLLLARLLLQEPDLMLLDEPSNHLDIDATEWLEDFLVQSSRAVVVVSHDRYLLDKVTSRTFELLQGTVDAYAGNFSAYLVQKAEQLEVQRRTYEKQQAEIGKMEDFVRRHHHGQKHAQAEDRRKKLERIERVNPPREISVPPMGFRPAKRVGDVALRVENLAKAFDKPLFSKLSFDILRGEKWGILGPNGCGKTTLLRCLLGQEEPDKGQAKFAENVKLGYFDQQLDGVDDRVPVLEAVRPDRFDAPEQQRRDLLARFGVTGDMVHQRVDSLSGGERNRAALARLAALEANFLILDEPTNHLDLWSRAALERSLQQFDGTVLFVSHDRYFLNQVADRLLMMQGDRFRVIDGNYDLYLHMVREGLAQTDRNQNGRANAPPQKSSRSPQNPPARSKRKFPYRKIPDLEAEIAEREQRIESLHQGLMSPEVLRDGQQVKQLQAELDTQNEQLATLYEHWEEAVEMN